MRGSRFSTIFKACSLGVALIAGAGGCEETSEDGDELERGEGDHSAAEGDRGGSAAAGDAGRGGTSEAGSSAGDAAATSSGKPDAGRGGGDAAPSSGDAGASNAADSGQGATRDAALADSGSPPSGGGIRRCGTRGGVQCSADQFCNFEPDPLCGATDRGGVCEPKPELCTADYQPVCGCDDRTYGNRCEAHSAGVAVQREGDCEGGTSPGATCGGFAGLTCDGDAFCNYEPEAGGQGCEGIADASGVCEPTPRGCTREYQPVCGCDYRTYANRCVAHQAGVSVLRAGECTEVDCKTIGGRVAEGLGPPPMCNANEVDHGPIRYTSGAIPIEGAICCVGG